MKGDNRGGQGETRTCGSYAGYALGGEALPSHVAWCEEGARSGPGRRRASTRWWVRVAMAAVFVLGSQLEAADSVVLYRPGATLDPNEIATLLKQSAARTRRLRGVRLNADPVVDASRATTFQRESATDCAPTAPVLRGVRLLPDQAGGAQPAAGAPSGNDAGGRCPVVAATRPALPPSPGVGEASAPGPAAGAAIPSATAPPVPSVRPTSATAAPSAAGAVSASGTLTSGTVAGGGDGAILVAAAPAPPAAVPEAPVRPVAAERTVNDSIRRTEATPVVSAGGGGTGLAPVARASGRQPEGRAEPQAGAGTVMATGSPVNVDEPASRGVPAPTLKPAMAGNVPITTVAMPLPEAIAQPLRAPMSSAERVTAHGPGSALPEAAPVMTAAPAAPAAVATVAAAVPGTSAAGAPPDTAAAASTRTESPTGVINAGDSGPLPPRPASVLSFALPVNFAFDSARILPDAYPQLDAVAQGIRLAGGGLRIVIEGHTDASGSPQYNQELSRLRALAVRDYLMQRQGIAAAQLRVVGMGKSAPLNPRLPTAAENRRVEFRAEMG